MQSCGLAAVLACLICIGIASIADAQAAPWPACLARGATLEASRIDVQDDGGVCLLLFASNDASMATGFNQSSSGSSRRGLPGVLLLNSSALIAGACISALFVVLFENSAGQLKWIWFYLRSYAYMLEVPLVVAQQCKEQPFATQLLQQHVDC